MCIKNIFMLFVLLESVFSGINVDCFFDRYAGIKLFYLYARYQVGVVGFDNSYSCYAMLGISEVWIRFSILYSKVSGRYFFNFWEGEFSQRNISLC